MASGMTVLAKAFRKISSDLQSSLEASGANPDSGTKGSIRETQLLTALRSHLPSRFEMRLGGTIVNGMGDISYPQDIVITDALVARPFMFGNQVHPIEAVCATVEVKSGSTKREIQRGVAQVASVKRLLRERLWQGEELDRVRAGHPEPSPFGAVFCYRMSAKAETINRNFLEACLTHVPADRPDTLCVLNEFTTQWRSNQRLVPFTGSTPHGARNLLRYETADAALYFYIFLLDRLSRYRPPPLELMWYLNNGGDFDFEIADLDLPTDTEPPPATG